MIDEKKKMTAQGSSVGADDGQSISKIYENSIPTSGQKGNDEIVNSQDSLEEMYRKIQRMTEYFVESSDMGKLYLNYPMVEAFYHMHDIPDAHFNKYFATQEELSNGTYKQRVNQENRNRNYTKFAVTKEECNAVIQQNIEKARWLCNVPDGIPDEISILSAELRYWEQQMISVLCTCVFYIPEYDPKLII